MPVPATRPTRQRVPQRLLAAAASLFAERGYDGTSVQEIVRRAGVTKGAMYHHFESKDDLLYEIYHRVLVMQTERLERIASSDLPVRERIREAAADVVVTTLANLDDAAVFFRLMDRLPASLRTEMRRKRRRYHERFRGLVEEGQRARVFRTAVSADLATHSFFGSVHHLATWYRPTGTLSPRQVGESFADLFLGGLDDTKGRS